MNFVLIANAWGAGVHNPTSKHQIALELSRQGHRVLWLEGAGMRRPDFTTAGDRRRVRLKVAAATRGVRRAAGKGEGAGIWVGVPLLIPLPGLGAVRALNGRLCRALLARWTRQLGFDAPVLVNYVPVLAGTMRNWPGRTIYHCVDRWDAFGMYRADVMAATHRNCCRLADVVIASSSALYEYCRRDAARVHLVNHGVNHAHFSRALAAGPRPADLPAGRLAGFFGLISEWIDQDLLCRTARVLEHAALVLIGDADVPIDALRAGRNIFLTGRRPFGELPAYAGHFDVGIIPFKVNELTRAVNPIKLREMLAAGCPVVSTALPEVEACRDRLRAEGGGEAAAAVSVAASPDEFAALVRYRVERPLPAAARRRLSDGVRGETWEARVREIVEIAAGTAASR